MINAYLDTLKKYAVFNGRARRSEYWYFALFNFIISFILSVLESVVDAPGIFSGIFALAVLLPAIGVSIRRLHDTGRSGWWMFFGLVPLIGAITLLVFMVQDSESEDNAFGPNPKAA